jgi:hypothetical protein
MLSKNLDDVIVQQIRNKLEEIPEKTERLRLLIWLSVTKDLLPRDKINQVLLENDSEDVVAQLNAGKTPASKTKILKLLRSIVDDVIFKPKQSNDGQYIYNAYRALSHDVKYLRQKSYHRIFLGFKFIGERAHNNCLMEVLCLCIIRERKFNKTAIGGE